MGAKLRQGSKSDIVQYLVKCQINFTEQETDLTSKWFLCKMQNIQKVRRFSHM